MRVSTLTMPIQYYTVSPRQGNKARKRNGMHEIGKEEIKLFLFAGNRIVYVKRNKHTGGPAWLSQLGI